MSEFIQKDKVWFVRYSLVHNEKCSQKILKSDKTILIFNK